MPLSSALRVSRDDAELLFDTEHDDVDRSTSIGERISRRARTLRAWFMTIVERWGAARTLDDLASLRCRVGRSDGAPRAIDLELPGGPTRLHVRGIHNSKAAERLCCRLAQRLGMTHWRSIDDPPGSVMMFERQTPSAAHPYRQAPDAQWRNLPKEAIDIRPEDTPPEKGMEVAESAAPVFHDWHVSRWDPGDEILLERPVTTVGRVVHFLRPLWASLSWAALLTMAEYASMVVGFELLTFEPEARATLETVLMSTVGGLTWVAGLVAGVKAHRPLVPEKVALRWDTRTITRRHGATTDDISFDDVSLLMFDGQAKEAALLLLGNELRLVLGKTQPGDHLPIVVLLARALDVAWIYDEPA